MAKQHQIDMYVQLRQELDRMCVPVILDKLNFQKFDIKHDGKVVGIFVASPDYIDCLYVLPEYRRKGIGAKVVTDWVNRYGNYGIRLHIINNNEVLSIIYFLLIIKRKKGTVVPYVLMRSDKRESYGLRIIPKLCHWLLNYKSSLRLIDRDNSLCESIYGLSMRREI